MTTPTEELATKCDAIVIGEPNEYVSVKLNGHIVFTPEKLQAFREAVEADSDAERMKQPSFTPLTCAGQIKAGYIVAFTSPEGLHKEIVREVLHAGTDNEEVIYNSKKNYYFITAMVLSGRSWHKDVTYAQPFPSTEQLQQRVKELEDVIKQRLSADAYAMQYSHLPDAADEIAQAGQDADEAMRKALANTQGDSK